MSRKNVRCAIGIDLNRKNYIVACFNDGKLICKVQVKCCVEYFDYCHNKMRNVVRFKEYYDDLVESDKVNELLKLVARDLVGIAKQSHAVIVFEDLGFRKYIDKGDFEKLSSIKYGKFVYYLYRECAMRGVELVIISPNGTSRKCSKCGNYNSKRKFNKNKFKCERCGYVVDKDINAAINIARKGLCQYLNGLDDVS